jgi:hypothetical protein
MQGGVEPARQVDDGAGAVDVGRALAVLVGGDVVDRRAMHDVIDAAQFGDGLVGEAEVRRGEVADQGFRAFAPLGGEPFEPGQRCAAHEHPHLGVIATVQDLRHHSAANEPGTAGNEIAHASHGHP